MAAAPDLCATPGLRSTGGEATGSGTPRVRSFRKGLSADSTRVANTPVRPPIRTTVDKAVSNLTRGDDFTTIRKPEDKLEFPIETMRDFLKTLGLKPSRGMRKVAFVEDAEDFNE